MILLIIPEKMRNTFREKYMEDVAETAFQCPCRSVHEEMGGSLFEDVCDSAGLIVLPHPEGEIDEVSLLLAKAMAQLRKPIYLYDMSNHSIVQVDMSGSAARKMEALENAP